MAIRSAYMLGAERVIAIDHFKKRLEMAEKGNAHTINFEDTDGVLDELNYLTGGQGPDSCIDAVGMEAHGHTITATLDRAKMAVGLATDRPDALRQAIQACRKGGTISIPGVYGGVLDKVPFGAAFGKGLTFKMGQTHTQKYMPLLLDKISKGEIDPSFVITHRITLDEAPKAYQKFNDQKDECIKVVIQMH
jgi:threonine dehydrogenase-like Zn-dependent dehydrogenase